MTVDAREPWEPCRACGRPVRATGAPYLCPRCLVGFTGAVIAALEGRCHSPRTVVVELLWRCDDARRLGYALPPPVLEAVR